MRSDSVAQNSAKPAHEGARLGVDPSRLAEVRREFDRKGLSVRQWAREHGFPETPVHDVLSGRRRCLRGQSHRIAVALGLKDGDDA